MSTFHTLFWCFLHCWFLSFLLDSNSYSVFLQAFPPEVFSAWSHRCVHCSKIASWDNPLVLLRARVTRDFEHASLDYQIWKNIKKRKHDFLMPFLILRSRIWKVSSTFRPELGIFEAKYYLITAAQSCKEAKRSSLNFRRAKDSSTCTSQLVTIMALRRMHSSFLRPSRSARSRIRQHWNRKEKFCHVLKSIYGKNPMDQSASAICSGWTNGARWLVHFQNRLKMITYLLVKWWEAAFMCHGISEDVIWCKFEFSA